MHYGSVCSGIEAAWVAWRGLGWRPTWLAEIDPFCCEVLKARLPGVPNLGDIKTIGAEHGPINLLVGGTPCQSFSVVGLRKGMDDDRGNLTGEYLRILGLLRPPWFVYENVPGILSADRGWAFAGFLRRLEELGYGYAWRVLDCRHFGVPQRRRRLFLVGHSGGRFAAAAAVLFDRRSAAEDARSAGEVRQDGPGLRLGGVRVVGWTGDPTPKFGDGVSPTLRAEQGGEGTGFARAGVVARFTPREMERLQGLPDDWTDVPFRGRPAGESPRKRAIGNSFPPPVLAWIGKRIQFLEEHT